MNILLNPELEHGRVSVFDAEKIIAEGRKGLADGNGRR
jgi:hypothetical protein